MILPLRLFSSSDTAAIAAHEESVLKFCKDVALEVLPMFGEGRRMVDVVMFERAALGYARPLALVLKHVDFIKNEDRLTTVKRALLRGASDLATKQSSFTPPALDLVVASSYTLAYPGGVDLYKELPDIYIRPSLRGDAAGFTRTIENMDMYWNDSMEGVRRLDLIGALEKSKVESERTYSAKLLAESKAKDGKGNYLDAHYYRRLLVTNSVEWRREQGDLSPKWVRICSYWSAARGAVQIPETKE